MTEEEAKTKWCPFAASRITKRHIFGTGRVWKNDDDGVYASVRCIGSACMAWRWDTRYFEDRETGKAYGTNAPERFMVEPGFCGLAGKP